MGGVEECERVEADDGIRAVLSQHLGAREGSRDRVQEQRGEDVVLGGEVVVQRGLPHPDRVGDPPDRWTATGLLAEVCRADERVQGVVVEVRKLRPPVPSEVTHVAVRIER